jgi:hypothetical protein
MLKILRIISLYYFINYLLANNHRHKKLWINFKNLLQNYHTEINLGFYCWRFETEELAQKARSKLAPSGIIICT